MGPFAAGEVVLVRFPFSDLTQTKLRPAVVLASAGRHDWVLCQVTSKAYADPNAIEVGAADLRTGSLQSTSYARPGKLFTGNSALVSAQVAALSDTKLRETLEAVVAVFRASMPPEPTPADTGAGEGTA